MGREGNGTPADGETCDAEGVPLLGTVADELNGFVEPRTAWQISTSMPARDELVDDGSMKLVFAGEGDSALGDHGLVANEDWRVRVVDV